MLFITHVIKLSVISELVWSLSCYSLNFSPSNDQTTEHGEFNDLPRGVRIPKDFSHPSQDSFIPSSCWKCSLRNLLSVAPSASVLLGCPTKCYKLHTRAHTCTPTHTHLGSSRLLVEHSLSQLQRPWFRIGKAKTREDWMVRLFPFPQIRPSRVFSLLEGKYTHYSACFMKVLTLVGRNQQKDRLSSAMLESRIFNMWLWGGTLTGSFWKWAIVLLRWADWYQALTTPSSDGARVWLHFSWGWSLFYSQGGRDWLWLNSGRSGDLNQV